MSKYSSSSDTAHPVFFDPTRHRWTAVKLLSTLALVCMVGLFSVLFLRILSGPELASFSLGEPNDRVVVHQPEAFGASGPAGPAPEAGGIAADAPGFFQQDRQP